MLIERGREAATLVMLATVGIVAGRSAIERLAWSAVAFGLGLATFGSPAAPGLTPTPNSKLP